MYIQNYHFNGNIANMYYNNQRKITYTITECIIVIRKWLTLISLFIFSQTIWIHSVNANQTDLQLKTDSSILMEATSGSILYEHNSKQKKYPASVTKIATAIYAIENANINEIVTVSDNARNAEGTRVYLEAGEQVTLEKLLYGLMINSGNDAAIAIAEHISGTEEQFAMDLTNYLIEKTGIQNTNFTNSSGLFDENHYSTAHDLAKIVQYAMKNEAFMKFFNAKELRWIGESWDTTIVSHHRLVNGEIPYEGITGGKNGYVPQSRYTLATTAIRDNMQLIAITLGGNKNDIYYDTTKLFDYGFGSFHEVIINSNTTYTLNDRIYSNPNPIHFYIHKELLHSTEIKDGGKLLIVNNLGETIKELQIRDVTPMPTMQNIEVSMSAIEPALYNEETPNNKIIASFLIVIFISIFLFSRVR